MAGIESLKLQHLYRAMDFLEANKEAIERPWEVSFRYISPLMRASRRRRSACDGKFVVHSNDDTLSAKDVALGYKQLQRIE
jgi:hypothetical protein